jgi:hypothetical protein
MYVRLSWDVIWSSNYLYHHVSGLISNEQHGFIRNRSCVTQLLSVFHTNGENLDRNIQTDILYLDFAKAFDSVDHNILLAKLKSYAWSDTVTGKLLNCMVCWLSPRSPPKGRSRWCRLTVDVFYVWSSAGKYTWYHTICNLHKWLS